MSLIRTIHDTIDEMTTTVEDIHRSVAAIPLDALDALAPVHGAIEEVRAVQDRSISAVYDTIRAVNRGVERLATSVVGR